MSQRRGLGRGLGALIPSGGSAVVMRVESTEPVTVAEVDTVVDLTAVPDGTGSSVTPEPAAGPDDAVHYREIPIHEVSPNPRQPRQVFDEEPLAELVDSIRLMGLLQPIVVRPVGDGYELVAGERRLRAAKIVGLEHIPALVRRTDDEDMLRDALLENLHRAQLNPLEEAAAYAQLLADFACTQDELAQRVGRSRPQVANTLRLLKLPTGVQRRVAAGVLSAGHARALLAAEGPDEMEQLAGRIVAEGLSVRAVEELVLVGGTAGPRPRRQRRASETPVEYRAAADRLADLLETRVRIEAGRAKGRIVVEFAAVDDLARIVQVIEGARG